ncbi:MAG: hypothetical protein LBU29_04175 [Endomicrobium sp.]|jgi:tetratricopeptide (TPR) repeat protein|nr:hypothetical protein [Endomicrobium sp.]
MKKTVINTIFMLLFIVSFLVSISVSNVIGFSGEQSLEANEIFTKIDMPENGKQKIKFLEELAQKYVRFDKYDLAVIVYKKLLNLRTTKNKKIEYHIKLGDAYDLQKNYVLSVESYKNALLFDKKNVDINLKIGNIFLKNNLYDFAKTNFIAALAIDKNSNAAKRGLGDVFFCQNIYTKAVDYYSQVASETYDKQIVMRIAKCYRSLNKIDNAIAILKAFMAAKDIDLEMIFLQGLLYMDKKEYVKAKNLFSYLVTNGVKNFKGCVYLALLYDLTGETLKAKKMFDKSYEINPSCSAVDFMRAKISYKLGRVYEAKEFANSAYGKAKTVFVKQQVQKLINFLNNLNK